MIDRVDPTLTLVRINNVVCPRFFRQQGSSGYTSNLTCMA